MKKEAVMKKYTEYIVLVLIIIVLTGILIFKKNNRINYVLPKIPNISDDLIDKISIKNGSASEIILKKIDNKWIIDRFNYKVDKKKINFILNDLKNLKITSLISTNKDYARYSLDNENGIVVLINLKNGKSFSLIIGKLDPNYSSTYVKLKNNPNIYLAEGNLRLTFDTNIDELRNKIIFSFNKDNVKWIKITDHKDIEIKRQDRRWIVNKKESKNKKTIDSLLDNLNNLECESYLKDKMDLQDYKKLYTIELEDDIKTHSLEIFSKKEDKEEKYIGESNEVKEQFVLSNYKIKEIIDLIKKL